MRFSARCGTPGTGLSVDLANWRFELSQTTYLVDTVILTNILIGIANQQNHQIYTYVSIHVLYIYTHLSFYRSIVLSIYLSVCLSVSLSVYLSIYPSIYLSIKLEIQTSQYIDSATRPWRPPVEGYPTGTSTTDLFFTFSFTWKNGDCFGFMGMVFTLNHKNHF